MRDQEKRPGELLKQLRETLGYNPEDWATIFDTETSTIQAIEAGSEIPNNFLTALLQWFLDGLEHPQNPTQVLPEGWEDDLPNAIGVLLNSIEHKNAALEDLQDAYDLQKKVIAHGNERAKGYQQQILNYLEIIRQQNDKIKALEGIKEVDQKTSNFKTINKLSVIAFFVMVASILFWHANQWALDQQIASQIKPMVWNNEVISVKLPVPITEKEVKLPLPSSETRSKSVKRWIQKIELKPSKALGKKVDSITTPKPIGLNKKLANLLANNAERNNHLLEKYSSPKGKTILRFNNPDQKPMIIILRNYLQQMIHRDTVNTKYHLLSTEKFTPGVYNYWIYFGQDKNYTHTGEIVIDAQK